MKQTRLLMGMPVTVEIVDESVTENIFDKIYAYFKYVDEKFSTYKETSEITLINKGEIKPEKYNDDIREVFQLAAETKKLTGGFFDIEKEGKIDPLGLVKGWAIWKAAKILEKEGYKQFYVEAGGDVQVAGKTWKVGIKNPFKKDEVVKILHIKKGGVATSGNYERGLHIWNPKTGKPADEIASMTVVGPNIYEADRFATAAFVMGEKGIKFIEKLKGFEGYMINKMGVATMTGGLEKYLA